jgi:hypothetical protein
VAKPIIDIAVALPHDGHSQASSVRGRMITGGYIDRGVAADGGVHDRAGTCIDARACIFDLERRDHADIALPADGYLIAMRRAPRDSRRPTSGLLRDRSCGSRAVRSRHRLAMPFRAVERSLSTSATGRRLACQTLGI